MKPHFIFTGLLTLLCLQLPAALGAEQETRRNFDYHDDGYNQSAALKYEIFENGEWRVFRSIEISRNRGSYGELNCALSYYGPLNESVKALVMSPQGNSPLPLGYVPIGSPIPAKWQGMFSCPKAGPWNVAVAFFDPDGRWDSDSGRNFNLQFQAFL